MPAVDRRSWLRTTIAAASGLAVGSQRPLNGAEDRESLSFAVLGDTHFDRLTHHDSVWLAKEHPHDVAQVRRYSEHAAALLPELFRVVARQTASEPRRYAAVVHVGDLIEGLCGNRLLADRQANEALEFLAEARFAASLLLTKGNHDVTGPGAAEAYREIVLPALSRGAGLRLSEARYAVERDGARFVMYDAYDSTSLDWLRETLGSTRKPGTTFVVVHPPVVPFQARGNWSLFIRPEQSARRTELLNLLGEHRAVVLCGHVHRYGFVVRRTERGPFAQLAISSILSARDQRPRQLLEGLEAYGPELTELEPKFQPESKAERRALFAAERPHLSHFEYADTAGYAVVRVSGAHVTADVFNGTAEQPWRTIDVTQRLTDA